MEASKISKKISSFYIVDLVKHLVAGKNWLALIYLVLNLVIVAMIPTFLFSVVSVGASAISIGIYIVIACLAISPVGETILRWQQGCKKIEDVEILNRLEPLFMEVKETAQRKHPDMQVSDKITLYIREDDDINAFALGRKTVCVTTGLLNCSDEQIKAVMGHEFGHLVTHDTDLILLITVGNFMIAATVTIIKLVILFWKLIFSLAGLVLGGSDGAIVRIGGAIATVLTILFVDLVMWIWTKIGVLLVMKSSRNAEYEADAFSCDLGYSEGLLSFLKLLQPAHVGGSKSVKSKLELFSVLSDSHPKTSLRIQRIEAFANETASESDDDQTVSESDDVQAVSESE